MVFFLRLVRWSVSGQRDRRPEGWNVTTFAPLTPYLVWHTCNLTYETAWNLISPKTKYVNASIFSFNTNTIINCWFKWTEITLEDFVFYFQHKQWMLAWWCDYLLVFFCLLVPDDASKASDGTDLHFCWPSPSLTLSSFSLSLLLLFLPYLISKSQSVWRPKEEKGK